MKNRLWKTLCGVALAVTFGGVLPGALHEDQLECEHAFVHLEECCHALTAPQVCGDGCNAITLSLDTSRCIQRSSCAQIQEAKICQRLESLSAAAVDGGITEEAICP